jgi:hypothetical protein
MKKYTNKSEYVSFTIIPPENKMLEILDKKHNIYYCGYYIRCGENYYVKLYDDFEKCDIIIYDFENFLWKII